VILHRAPRLPPPAHQKTLLQFPDVERVGVEVLGCRPLTPTTGSSLAFALFGIIVKALAVLAAEAALFLRPSRPTASSGLVDSVGAEIGFGRSSCLKHQIERNLVGQRSGPPHAAISRVLDHRRRHAFHQHFEALGGEAQHAAIGKEAAESLTHDRVLPITRHVSSAWASATSPVFLADDEFPHIIFSTGEKK